MVVEIPRLSRYFVLLHMEKCGKQEAVEGWDFMASTGHLCVSVHRCLWFSGIWGHFSNPLVQGSWEPIKSQVSQGSPLHGKNYWLGELTCHSQFSSDAHLTPLDIIFHLSQSNLSSITSRCSGKEPALLPRTHGWTRGLITVNFDQ